MFHGWLGSSLELREAQDIIVVVVVVVTTIILEKREEEGNVSFAW
jgi:hypothetical protein